jgi:hypothetical protein
MTKVKMPKGDINLDLLNIVPTPSDAISIFLPEACADDILASCSEITIDQLGEALIMFGNAMAAGAPPSLRMDFDVVEGSPGGVTGKIIVQGKPTQELAGKDVPSTVAAAVRATAEQSAYQSDDDAVRVTVLTQWSRGLFVVSNGLDASSNSILAAAEMKNQRESEGK